MNAFQEFRESLYSCTLEILGPTLGKIVLGM